MAVQGSSRGPACLEARCGRRASRGGRRDSWPGVFTSDRDRVPALVLPKLPPYFMFGKWGSFDGPHGAERSSR
jgi:hypothetical protein